MLRHIMTTPVPAGLLAVLLLLLPTPFPLLTPLQVIVPLPLLLVAWYRGSQAGWLAASLPLLATLPVGGGLRLPVVVFVFFIGFPLLAAWLLRRGWKMTHCAGAALLIGAVLLAAALLALRLFGVDPEAVVTEAMGGFQKNLLTTLSQTKGMTPAIQGQLQLELDRFVQILALFFPALLVTGWFLVHIGNLVLARAFARRWGGEGLDPEGLVQLRLPFNLVWGFIATSVLAMVTEGGMRQLGANLAFFLAVPYFFQGLAIVQWSFRRFKVRGFMRGVVITALIFWTQGILLVVVTGLFDTWIDFRRRFQKTREGDSPPER